MKNKNMIVPVMLFLSVTFNFVSVFSFPQKIETKNDIRIVHNKKGGKWGKRPKVSLRLIRTLGGIDVEDENYAFYRPYDISLDSSGNMYIVDNANCRIQKFNSEGKYLTTMGRPGQGPGEFQSPISIDIDSKDFLYIADTPQRKIHILTPDGKEHKTIIITGYHVVKARYLDPGRIAMGGNFGWIPDEEKTLPKLVKVFDLDGNLQYSFGDILDYKDNWVSQHGNWFDYDVDKKGCFYLSFRYQNRIEKYSSKGKIIWKATRLLNFNTKLLDKGHHDGSGGQAPKFNTVSSGIAVDEKGRVWVATLDRQETMEELYAMGKIPTKKGIVESPETINAYKLEIFDTDGLLLGKIPLNHRVHGMRIFKNYLFTWERNYTKYYQYEIVEK
jgi:hypothetical protein